MRPENRIIARRVVSAACCSVVLLGAWLCTWEPLRAGPPDVTFDTLGVVSCREITPEEFAEANPGEKVVEARLRVSTFMAPRGGERLAAIVYRIESPLRSFEVFDYLPRTTLDTAVVGNVSIDRREEDATTFGLTLSGSYEKMINGTGSAGHDEKSFHGVRYESLPELELVSASGPVARGAGVYFKLKPTTRTSLEGEKEFVVMMRTPRGWRADYATLECQAVSEPSGFGESRTLGFRRVYVALHAEGDAEAQLAARRFSRDEQILLETAAAHQRAIQRRSLPTIAHQFGAMVSLVDPKIDEHWLARVHGARPGASLGPLVDRLPEPVRRAALSYLASKHRLAELNGWGETSPRIE